MSSIPDNVPNHSYYVGVDKIKSNLKNQQSQLDKFKEAARRLETDDDENRFEQRLKKLVKKGNDNGDPDCDTRK